MLILLKLKLLQLHISDKCESEISKGVIDTPTIKSESECFLSKLKSDRYLADVTDGILTSSDNVFSIKSEPHDLTLFLPTYFTYSHKIYSATTKYYAVRKGRKPGIYTSYPECYAQVHGYSGSQYKSFHSRREAEAFMRRGMDFVSDYYYAVARGHEVGIFRSYAVAQKAVNGFKGGCMQRFDTYEEARRFINLVSSTISSSSSSSSTEKETKKEKEKPRQYIFCSTSSASSSSYEEVTPTKVKGAAAPHSDNSKTNLEVKEEYEHKVSSNSESKQNDDTHVFVQKHHDESNSDASKTLQYRRLTTLSSDDEESDSESSESSDSAPEQSTKRRIKYKNLTSSFTYKDYERYYNRQLNKWQRDDSYSASIKDKFRDIMNLDASSAILKYNANLAQLPDYVYKACLANQARFIIEDYSIFAPNAEPVKGEAKIYMENKSYWRLTRLDRSFLHGESSNLYHAHNLRIDMMCCPHKYPSQNELVNNLLKSIKSNVEAQILDDVCTIMQHRVLLRLKRKYAKRKAETRAGRRQCCRAMLAKLKSDFRSLQHYDENMANLKAVKALQSQSEFVSDSILKIDDAYFVYNSEVDRSCDELMPLYNANAQLPVSGLALMAQSLNTADRLLFDGLAAVLDSGSTFHAFPNTLKELCVPGSAKSCYTQITCADGATLTSNTMADFVVKDPNDGNDIYLLLKNVRLFQTLEDPLISITKLLDQGLCMWLTKERAEMYRFKGDSEGNALIVPRKPHTNNLFQVPCSWITNLATGKALVNRVYRDNKNPIYWHNVLGHRCYAHLKDIIFALTGKSITPDDLPICSGCSLAKIENDGFASEGRHITGDRMNKDVGIDVQHTSVRDPFNNKYVIRLIEYYSKRTHTVAIKRKSEFARHALCLLQRRERMHPDNKLCYIHMDNELPMHSKFKDMIIDKGVVPRCSAPGASTQNSHVEREHRTHLNCAQAMRATANLPKTFLIPAMLYYEYISNRIPRQSKLRSKKEKSNRPLSPIEIDENFDAGSYKSLLRHCHPFGCEVYVPLHTAILHKSDLKGARGILLGRVPTQKSYLVMLLDNGGFIHSRSAIINAKCLPFAEANKLPKLIDWHKSSSGGESDSEISDSDSNSDPSDPKAEIETDQAHDSNSEDDFTIAQPIKAKESTHTDSDGDNSPNTNTANDDPITDMGITYLKATNVLKPITPRTTRSGRTADIALAESKQRKTLVQEATEANAKVSTDSDDEPLISYPLQGIVGFRRRRRGRSKKMHNQYLVLWEPDRDEVARVTFENAESLDPDLVKETNEQIANKQLNMYRDLDHYMKANAKAEAQGITPPMVKVNKPSTEREVIDLTELDADANADVNISFPSKGDDDAEPQVKEEETKSVAFSSKTELIEENCFTMPLDIEEGLDLNKPESYPFCKPFAFFEKTGTLIPACVFTLVNELPDEGVAMLLRNTKRNQPQVGITLVEDIKLPRFAFQVKGHQYEEEISDSMDLEWQGLVNAGCFHGPVTMEEVKRNGCQITPTLWVYRAKPDDFGFLDKIKSRLTLRGDIMNKFDKSTSDKGSVFDAFAPVTRLTIMRTLLAMHFDDPNVKFYQMDIKQAFITADMKRPVYIKIPPQFVKTGEEPLILLLRKALYGGSDSPRCFFDDYKKKLMKGFGFQPIHSDPCYLQVYKGNSYIKLCWHVDDSLCVSKGEELWKEFIAFMDSIYLYTVSDLHHMVGIIFERDAKTGCLRMHQQPQVDKILRAFPDLVGKARNTPIRNIRDMPTDKDRPTSEEEIKRAASYPMMQIVGHLLWLHVCTFPELSFPLKVSAKYVHAHGDKVHAWTNNMLNYLKSNQHSGIIFKPSANKSVEAFTDSNHLKDTDNCKPISGSVIKIGGNLG